MSEEEHEIILQKVLEAKVRHNAHESFLSQMISFSSFYIVALQFHTTFKS